MSRLATLRRWLLKLPVLIALGLITTYLLFAYLAFPPLAKWAASHVVASKSGHVLTLADARFDPWRLSLTLDGLALSEPDGQPLLGFGRGHGVHAMLLGAKGALCTFCAAGAVI